MSLFTKQPGFCCVCGKAGEYEPEKKRAMVCSYGENSCWEELEWRYVLSLRGKDYYPKEETK
jgi:hypothetical protein